MRALRCAAAPLTGSPRSAAALTAARALLTPQQRDGLPPLGDALGEMRTISRRREDGPDEESVEEELGGGGGGGEKPPRRAGAWVGDAPTADPSSQELSPLPPEALEALQAAVQAASRRGEPEVAHVLLFCHNRPAYLRRTLGSLLRVHARDARFPITVSQDVGGVDVGGMQAATAAVAREYGASGVGFQQHTQAPAASLRLEKPTDNPGYYHIAAHYKWALGRAFGQAAEGGGGGAQRVIVLEDDMELAPDFFEYFAGLAGVLDADESLWCVSGWNDNGRSGLADDPSAAYRTDFFPGLGWMLTRRLWEAQLRDSWPAAYWDDWMRLNVTRRGRQCVRPELCRTYNFGRRGTSGASFFDAHLRDVRLAQQWVPWSSQDLSAFSDPAAYEASFVRQLGGARRVRTVAQARRAAGDVALGYDSEAAFGRAAKLLGAFAEWRDGMPRTSYRGVVVLSLNGGGARLFLAPEAYLAAARAQVADLVRLPGASEG